MKKYILPSISVLCIVVGFIIGNAVSNKVNAQHFYIQNGQLMVAPSSKTDQLLQLVSPTLCWMIWLSNSTRTRRISPRKISNW